MKFEFMLFAPPSRNSVLPLANRAGAWRSTIRRCPLPTSPGALWKTELARNGSQDKLEGDIVVIAVMVLSSQGGGFQPSLRNVSNCKPL